MDCLTESEIAQIVRLEEDDGVRLLSHHFQWSEFCDDRQRYHQEFVYDIATFTADRGFPWPDVIRLATLAKNIYPKLDDFKVHELASLLKDVLHNLTPVHQQEFIQYFADTCIARRKLFQAVVGGSADLSVTQLHLEVQLPPTPLPLVQGRDLLEWEMETELQTKRTFNLQQVEEELKLLRDGRRLNLGDLSVPEDKQSAVEQVRAAVRGAGKQMLASLSQEASLLFDIMQIKLQEETGEQ